MRAFYKDDLVTLYRGDNLTLLDGLETGSIDQVVTSPPFNANMEYEINLWRSLTDYLQWLEKRFQALFPVCSPGAWVHIEIQDLHVSPEHTHAHPGQKEQFNMATSSYLTTAMIEAGFYFKGEVIWDRGRWVNNMAGKMACAPGSPALLVQHSKILFFRKPGGRKGVYKYPEQSNVWKAKWCRTVWNHIQPEHNPGHPAVMPYSMASGLIQGWSLPDSTILDLFAGSGTTLRAAKDLGRRSIGIEAKDNYCRLAADRLRQQSILGYQSLNGTAKATLPEQLELDYGPEA